MALMKVISLPNGIEATYWNISRVNYNKKKSELKVNICGFVSEEMRLLNKAPALEIPCDFSFSGDTISLADIYEMFKLDSRFQGSTDC